MSMHNHVCIRCLCGLSQAYPCELRRGTYNLVGLLRMPCSRSSSEFLEIPDPLVGSCRPASHQGSIGMHSGQDFRAFAGSWVQVQ